MTDILARLKGVRRRGKGWIAKCPAHDDAQNSLSVDRRHGKWLLKCDAGCTFQEIAAAMDVAASDLLDAGEGQGAGDLGKDRATGQPPGLSLDRYAATICLPVDFLRDCGLSEIVLVAPVIENDGNF
jgi:hypothetical protein